MPYSHLKERLETQWHLERDPKVVRGEQVLFPRLGAVCLRQLAPRHRKRRLASGALVDRFVRKESPLGGAEVQRAPAHNNAVQSHGAGPSKARTEAEAVV